jgi:hypothetical protein
VLVPRPDGLPDFTNPPLSEVVVSTQFATPPKYSEAYIREIWALFERDFPNVQEMPALPPTFEVFGGSELPRRAPTPAMTSPHNGHHRCQQYFVTSLWASLGRKPQTPAARVGTSYMFVHWN